MIEYTASVILLSLRPVVSLIRPINFFQCLVVEVDVYIMYSLYYYYYYYHRFATSRQRGSSETKKEIKIKLVEQRRRCEQDQVG